MAETAIFPTDDSDGSMETILASIRRIIREDDVAPTHEQPAARTADAAPAAGEDELLVLLPSMMVQPDRGEQGAMLTETIVPVPPGISATALAAALFDNPAPTAATPQAPRLLADETRAAAVQSLAALQEAVRIDQPPPAGPNLLRSGGPTLEELVRDELRGQLKVWLDANLPALVERVVRQEIEQLVRRPA